MDTQELIVELPKLEDEFKHSLEIKNDLLSYKYAMDTMSHLPSILEALKKTQS